MITSPGFWASLFGVTLIQIALGADNLIIITILANKLPEEKRKKAINLGLIIAMALRIILLFFVSLILKYAAKPFTDDDWGTERQVEAENAFGCFLVDEILPVKDAQKWEEYALKATTEEMVDYGIELVGRRHHYSAPVDLDSKDVKRLKRIKDAAERLLADAQAGGNRQYAFELWVDGGELADCCHKLDELVNYIDDELNK